MSVPTGEGRVYGRWWTEGVGVCNPGRVFFSEMKTFTFTFENLIICSLCV